ncbi:hypothetical protein DST30_11275 [Salmonella enterica subsp. enterica serovar Panama]|nr:hypothetical protein [Salmonella enterica subsp. enterica serovar Panama]
MSEQEKEVIKDQAEDVARSESNAYVSYSEPVGSEQEGKEEPEPQASEATYEEAPAHPPLIDFSKATIRFQCDDIRPKNPKKTKRQPLMLPLYSPRVHTAFYQQYIADALDTVQDIIANRQQPTEEQFDRFNKAAIQSFSDGQYQPNGDAQDRALERKGSQWTNVPVDASGVGRVIPGIPQPNHIPDDVEAPLTGSDAIYFAIRNTKSGAPAVMPLWHSGIKLQFNPPSNERVAIMHERIARDKILGGRDSAGFLFSATSIITMKHAIELALECCYMANVPNLDIQRLKDIIPVTDVPALLLNVLVTMYPYGYPYVQTCYQNPDTCDYRVEEIVSFAKLYQVDNSAITKRMRQIMTEGPVMTDELLREYANELGETNSRTLDLSDNGSVIIELEVPKISRHIAMGERWLSDTLEDLRDILSRPSMTEEERDRVIRERQFYSWMRQYDAWIKSMHVSVNGTMRRVSEADTPVVLAQLSRDSDLRERYIDGLMQFIGDSTIALAAMPAWKCPKCNEDIADNLRDQKYYDLIALDVPQLFFTLNSVQSLREGMDAVF